MLTAATKYDRLGFGNTWIQNQIFSTKELWFNFKIELNKRFSIFFLHFNLFDFGKLYFWDLVSLNTFVMSDTCTHVFESVEFVMLVYILNIYLWLMALINSNCFYTPCEQFVRRSENKIKNWVINQWFFIKKL